MRLPHARFVRVARAGMLPLAAITLLLGSALAARAAREEKIPLGFLLPLSGNFAPVGNDCRQGVEAALVEKGQPANVSILFADSKADPATALTEYRKLADADKAIGAFAFRGPVGMAVSPVAKAGKIPLLGGVGNKDFTLNNPYAFQVWPRSDEEGEFLAKKFLEHGFKRAAIVTLEDDWTAAVSAGFKDAYTKAGGTVTLEEAILPGESDFKTFASRLRRDDATAIFLNVGLAQSGVFIKQLREQQLAKPIFSNFWSAKKESLDAAGPGGSEGVMFVEMATGYPKLAETLRSKFDAKASGATLSSYAAAIWLLQAIESSATSPETEVTSAERLFAALSAQKELRTADGIFPIVDRQVKFPLVLKTIRNGVGVIE